MLGSSLPIGPAVTTFLIGDVPGGFRKMDGADFAIDFGAERGSDGGKAGSGDFFQVVLFNFLLELLEPAGENLPAFVPRAEDPFGERLGFSGAQVGDLKLMLPTPLDEGGLRDAEFDGDAVIAPALRTQEDEAGDGFLIGHF
jgi:hypothetical protein